MEGFIFLTNHVVQFGPSTQWKYHIEVFDVLTGRKTSKTSETKNYEEGN